MLLVIEKTGLHGNQLRFLMTRIASLMTRVLVGLNQNEPIDTIRHVYHGEEYSC